MIATSRHHEGRTTSATLDEAWISDLQLVRSELSITQDVTPIVIPPSMLSHAGLSHQVPSGLQSKVSNIFQRRNSSNGVQLHSDAHAEDADGDLLMTDHDSGLLDKEFVLRLRMSGPQGPRSPRGSPSSEPDPKRPQHVPPRPVFLSTPLLSSLPSYHSSDTNS
ncbi:hypothetical protein PHMEG_00015750 [Phytophthora megakarya]|uniref:Uncharacterized protein n=1 Tax=Phytophthora megakarya TaxID=4795 RepID=A0A225W0M7_9STRA|nr:hypothetical protein PHMEG_00015750 [Phytophthora megakarya]